MFRLTRLLRVDVLTLLCFGLVMLPFLHSLLRIEVGIITFNPYTLSILAMVPMVFLRMFFGRGRYGFNAQDIAIFALSVVYMTASLLSTDLVGAGYRGFHALFIPVISYFVLKGMVQSEDDYARIVMALVLGVVIFSVVVLLQYMVTFKRGEVAGMPPIGASALTISATFVLVCTAWRRRAIAKLFIGTSMAALVVSFSRVFMTVFLLSWFLWKVIRRGFAFYLMLALLAGGMLGTILLASIEVPYEAGEHDKAKASTMERVINPEYWKYTLAGRSHYYREGFKVFLQNPILGTGFQRDKKVRHSAHLEWLEYGGMVGYLLYASVFLTHFWRCRKQAKIDPFVAVNLLIVTAVLLNGSTNPFTLGIGPYLAFIAMGLNEARLRLMRKPVMNASI